MKSKYRNICQQSCFLVNSRQKDWYIKWWSKWKMGNNSTKFQEHYKIYNVKILVRFALLYIRGTNAHRCAVEIQHPIVPIRCFTMQSKSENCVKIGPLQPGYLSSSMLVIIFTSQSLEWALYLICCTSRCYFILRSLFLLLLHSWLISTIDLIFCGTDLKNHRMIPLSWYI